MSSPSPAAPMESDGATPELAKGSWQRRAEAAEAERDRYKAAHEAALSLMSMAARDGLSLVEASERRTAASEAARAAAEAERARWAAKANRVAILLLESEAQAARLREASKRLLHVVGHSVSLVPTGNGSTEWRYIGDPAALAGAFANFPALTQPSSQEDAHG